MVWERPCFYPFQQSRESNPGPVLVWLSRSYESLRESLHQTAESSRWLERRHELKRVIREFYLSVRDHLLQHPVVEKVRQARIPVFTSVHLINGFETDRLLLRNFFFYLPKRPRSVFATDVTLCLIGAQSWSGNGYSQGRLLSHAPECNIAITRKHISNCKKVTARKTFV